jgi:type IX secretion system PorP/SprF family membrane protein
MVSTAMYGQLEPQFTHFSFLSSQGNPGFSGSGNEIRLTAIHRSQWVNLTSQSINTQGLSGSFPIRSINSGVGFFFMRDVLGHQSSIYSGLDYSYQIPLGEFSLGLGVRGGLIWGNLDGASLRAPEGAYGSGQIDHNDVILPQTSANGITADFSAGIAFSGKGLSVGLGLAHVFAPSLGIDFPGGTTSIGVSRTLIFNAGYDIKVSSLITIPVSAVMRTDFVQYQADFQSRLLFNDNIWIGISLRGYSGNSFDGVSAMFGFTIKETIGIGYSYDINTSSLNSFNSGSHEIMMFFRNPLKQPSGTGRIIYNPRFL